MSNAITEIPLTDLIALLRAAISSSLAADATARESIATMTDEEVVAYARQQFAATEAKADAFITDLEEHPPR